MWFKRMQGTHEAADGRLLLGLEGAISELKLHAIIQPRTASMRVGWMLAMGNSALDYPDVSVETRVGQQNQRLS
jgi:hypothetical protein